MLMKVENEPVQKISAGYAITSKLSDNCKAELRANERVSFAFCLLDAYTFGTL